jgi:hypothetical protein
MCTYLHTAPYVALKRRTIKSAVGNQFVPSKVPYENTEKSPLTITIFDQFSLKNYC